MQKECKDFFIGRTLAEWQEFYREGKGDPAAAIGTITMDADDPAWITRLDEGLLRSQLEALALRLEEVKGDLTKLPLYGVPFAVKDNIDAAGWPTTAACPAFRSMPGTDATVVQRLRMAGAIVVGKTNMDQFATGLVGTRSPYGVVPNVFRPEYISGGSSSGSASVVARGIVPFALGTDTAGSGRVPAGMNNIVGMKPTRGRLSCRGLVPACRTLDCVSVMALTVGDAACIAAIAAAFDENDPYSRVPPEAEPAGFPERPRVAVPHTPEFFGDAEARAAFDRAKEIAVGLGAEIVPIDFEPFAALASLLYEGPWIAERFTVLEPLWAVAPDAIDPVVRRVVEGWNRFSATDVFKFEYRRAELARIIERTMNSVDVLLLPTTPTMFTIEEVLSDPIRLNAKLGLYTNFANFADMCALALPAGMRGDGLPAGVTLLAKAWHDQVLTEFGVRWQEYTQEKRINTALGVLSRETAMRSPLPYLGRGSAIRVAVVGAHLRGMPLNHQLTSRNAVFVEETSTAREYRLYALANGIPAKPALVRVAPGEAGEAIAVELWDVPASNLGPFTAEVPPPLGIGSITLCDGQVVKGFICEPYGVIGARDISSFRGWKAYLASEQERNRASVQN